MNVRGTAYWLSAAPISARAQTLLGLSIGALAIFSIISPIMMGLGAEGGGSGNVLRQLCYVSVAGLVLYALNPFHKPERLAAVPIGLVAALAWATLSLTWAIEPGIAVRRLGLTALIIWTVCAAVRQIGYQRTVAIIRGILIAALIANYLAVFLFPMVGIHQAADALDKNLIGDWRGIMTQKNFAGAICGVTVVFFFFDGRGINPFLRAAMVAGSLIFLEGSGSRTSLAGCLGAVLCGIFYLGYHARYRFVVVPVLVIGLLAVCSMSNFFDDPWSLLLKNQTNLSGRVAIWDMVWRYSMDHRMLGAGYGSFWDIGPRGPAFRYGKGWLWEIASGHNGFLDLLATIGLPGLILVLVGTAILPLARLLASRTANGPHGALLFALIVFTLAHNSAESTLFDRDAISWMFMMFAIALVWAVTPDRTLRHLFTRTYLQSRRAMPAVGGRLPEDEAVKRGPSEPSLQDYPVKEPARP